MLNVIPDHERRPYEEALVAAQRGWQVIPIHGVVDGECTCRRPGGCNSPGKHPLNKNWPELGSTDPDRVEIMFGTDLGLERVSASERLSVAPPTMPNLGILTGSPSGLVVLDVDPRNGGDETLLDLEHIHGRLPDTVQVLTGGGGWHYFFALPDGLMLASGVIREGLDLKAHGGFVVGPGSRHAKGGPTSGSCPPTPTTSPWHPRPPGSWSLRRHRGPPPTSRSSSVGPAPRPRKTSGCYGLRSGSPSTTNGRPFSSAPSTTTTTQACTSTRSMPSGTASAVESVAMAVTSTSSCPGKSL